MEVNDFISSDIELADIDYNIVPLSYLFRDVDGVILIFLSYLYDDINDRTNNMEKLTVGLNDYFKEFMLRGVRLVCITREPPITNIHWKVDRKLDMQIYSDISLSLTSRVIGTFDLSAYYLAKRNLYLGSSFLVPLPGIAIVGKNNVLLYKHVATSPDTVKITPVDILSISSEKIKFMNLDY
mmetsp:Transcript_8188/g.7335  ORF Transcript_8188/g.7335 Transcript_8188/m.7335 type:complete len:182 (-) Transcript_8188:159-704(-)